MTQSSRFKDVGAQNLISAASIAFATFLVVAFTGAAFGDNVSVIAPYDL